MLSLIKKILLSLEPSLFTLPFIAEILTYVFFIACGVYILSYVHNRFIMEPFNLLEEESADRQQQYLLATLKISTAGLVMNLLNSAEKDKAEKLLALNMEEANADLVAKVGKLSLMMNQYSDLQNRFHLLDKALEEENAELENGDELMPYTNVGKPVILAKQVGSGQILKAVPTSTRITELVSLELSFRLGRHPLTREPFDAPAPYKKKATHFFWHDYDGYSHELNSQANRIRKTTRKIVALQAAENDNPQNEAEHRSCQIS